LRLPVALFIHNPLSDTIASTPEKKDKM